MVAQTMSEPWNVDAARRTAEVQLANRLDDLHQMLYRRGGIRPTNAAVEELAKLLLLRVWLLRAPDATVAGHGSLRHILDPWRLRSEEDVLAVKAAFQQAIVEADLAAMLPDGTTQAVWPADEPLRLTQADVISEALSLLADAVPTDGALATQDLLGSAFDIFLRGRYDHSGGLGTFLTPNPVTAAAADIALALVDPMEGSGVRFGDPCCGTGRFLVAVLERLRERAGLDPDELARVEEFQANGIFGADQSASSVAKARINLLMYGTHHPQVFTVEDSVTAHALDPLRGTLGLILTNPPFGEGKYDSPDGIALAARAIPGLRNRSRIDPALAFVARCLDLLRPGGVLGIVLPDGLLDSSALKDVLLPESDAYSSFGASVVACISLPTATFALSGTVAKTSLLFLRKAGSPSEAVILARSAHVGYLRQGTRAVEDPHGNDLSSIAAKLSRIFSPHDLRAIPEGADDAGLVVALPRGEVDSLTSTHWDAGSTDARLQLQSSGAVTLGQYLVRNKRRSRREWPLDAPFVSVLHVDDIGSVAWHEALRYEPVTPGQLAEAGDLLLSLLNPSKLRACVVPDDYPVVQCSMEFGVFSPKDVDAYAVLALLHEPRVRAQLAPMGRGTSSSRRRVDAVEVLGLVVPELSDVGLKQLGEDTRSRLEAIRVAQLGLWTEYETLGGTS